MMFGSDRTQLRQLYLDVWRRHRRGEPLEPLEQLLARVIRQHPEYHGLLDRPHIVKQDFPPDLGEPNPFLHMAMHVAILEQVTADRPAGMRSLYRQLLPRFDSEHALEHGIMECLGECLWQAQREGRQPDEIRYTECVRRLLRS